MIGTEQERAELAKQYNRIGCIAGERWPAPPENLTPQDLLALLRGIGDAAGRAGYVAALGRLKKHWAQSASRA